MTMMLMMRHSKGLREETRKACDESSLGGGMELDIQGRAEISGSEKRAPHDVHGCSSLSPFLNSHLEVCIVRHTHRAGKKNTVSASTNSNVSFGGSYGCSNLSLSSHRWVLGKDGDEEEDDDDDVDDDDGDDDETLRRGCCVKRLTRHMQVCYGMLWT